MAILGEARAIIDGSGRVFPGTRTGKQLSDMTLSKHLRDLGLESVPHVFHASVQNCRNLWLASEGTQLGIPARTTLAVTRYPFELSIYWRLTARTREYR